MGRFGSVTLTAALAVLAGGCVHVHTDADGKVKSVALKAGAAKDGPVADAGVKQASATVPAAAVPAAAGGLTKLAAKLPVIGAGPPVSSLSVAWQNRVAQLPDPTSSGQFKPGLVGQLFLIGGGRKMEPATADGKLTVELFDASPRVGNEPVRLGSWTFEKDVLAQLVTTDDRFGKCYALFLPWPTYTPAVSRVKMMAKYEPTHGHTLHAEPMTMTIDTSVGGEGGAAARSAAAAAAWGPAVPVQPSAPTYPSAPGGVPAGLPPLTITMPAR